ncbi:MAG: hypothetical protein C0603_01600 [Denitrovibrio sp.]|nr:MAG: hypothetical protein C0603_01600 [Denitrovibrio sp.]
MLNPKYVFVFEGANDALAVNLNNFCTINFDDAKREILIDYGTTERVITLDDDKDFFDNKELILETIAGE